MCMYTSSYNSQDFIIVESGTIVPTNEEELFSSSDDHTISTVSKNTATSEEETDIGDQLYQKIVARCRKRTMYKQFVITSNEGRIIAM